MTNITEIVQYDAGVYQIETTDPVLGGPQGIANLQAKALANRTAFLYKQITDILSGLTIPIGLSTIAYVQAQLDKLDHKQSVRVASTANISLSGVQTIDGVSVQSGDRILVKNQGDATQNGLWVANGSTWSRASDANESPEVTTGLEVYVEEGVLQGKSRWQLTTVSPIVIGTTALTFGDITEGYAPLKSPKFLESPTVPTLARFASGSGIVNADTLNARGVQASGVRSVALTLATITLAASDAGSIISITGSGGGTLALPAANSVPAGAIITVRADNTQSSSNTLKASGSDGIYSPAGAGVSSLILKHAETISLTSDGVSKWLAVSGSSFGRLLNIQTMRLSGVYTPTPGTRFYVARLVGGGAAGSGSAATNSGQVSVGGGGASGSVLEILVSNPVSESVVVGIGGKGTSGGTGNSGGETRLGSMALVPGGVSGGSVAVSSTNTFNGGSPGVAGALPTTAAQLILASRGQPGGLGTIMNGFVFSGSGGSGPFGGGGVGNYNGPGLAASGPGSGGSGGASPVSSSATAGGDGDAGIIIFWEYL